MLKSFSVRNFRCLEEFEVSNLARVNLLVGDNNAGKTALLEAFFAHLSEANPVSFVTLKSFRRSVMVVPDETFWQEFFSDLDDSRTIQLTSIDAAGMRRKNSYTVGAGTQFSVAVPQVSGGPVETILRRVAQSVVYRPLKVEYDDGAQGTLISNEVILDATVPAFAQRNNFPLTTKWQYFSTAGSPDVQVIARHLSELLVNKQDAVLVSLLKTMDQRVKGISVASPRVVSEIFVDLGENYLVPVTLMGSGVVRALGIASEMAFSKGGVALVDEIEDGIYYKRLGDLWGAIYEMAKQYDVQIIASTHSAECVTAAFDAVTPDLKDADPLHVYRLVAGRRAPIPYERKSLKTMAEFVAEVR
jgi:GTPase SAR1 family protein